MSCAGEGLETVTSSPQTGTAAPLHLGIACLITTQKNFFSHLHTGWRVVTSGGGVGGGGGEQYNSLEVFLSFEVFLIP